MDPTAADRARRAGGLFDGVADFRCRDTRSTDGRHARRIPPGKHHWRPGRQAPPEPGGLSGDGHGDRFELARADACDAEMRPRAQPPRWSRPDPVMRPLRSWTFGRWRARRSRMAARFAAVVLVRTARSSSRKARRDQLYPPVVPLVRRQRCSPSASRPGVQPWQLHADAGDAADGGAVVAEACARG
jgi:hypothetical protein